MAQARDQSLPAANVSHRLTSFIGREVELAEIQRLLRERRLVTLTGIGGSGKTRLATEAAAVLAPDFPDGVYLVELAPLSRPDLVLETVAHALNAAEPPGPEGAPSLYEVVAGFLRNRCALLVLDNCEHLLDECARLCDALLSACANLRVLATSLEPLGIAGESLFSVPLLSLPVLDTLSDPGMIEEFESVRLFVDRARLVDSGFVLTGSNAVAVAQVCVRLDGIPLAIELAAAALRSLSLSELAARLDQRFRLLSGGSRTALPRHRTLQALLDWSYTLLDAGQQTVFRRLALFPDEWTVDAAKSVCAGEDTGLGGGSSMSPEDVLNILMQLVDKSLVQLDHASGRYRMLETVRLYVLRKLQAAGEQESIAGQHAAWYLDFAEHGTAHLGSPTQQEWFLRLESEQANLRAALSWAVETGHSEEGARLALALWKFWTARAYHREALHWLEQVLSLDSSAPIDTRLKVRLLNALGFVAQEVKSFEQSTEYYTEALRILREQGDSGGAIVSLLNLGWKSFVAADLDAAERYAEEGLTLARREGDVRSVGIALNLLSSVRIAAGRLDGVIPATEEALSISRHLGDLPEVANTLSTYAQAERMLGNLEHACALLLEGLHLQASLGTYTGLLASIVGMFLFARDTCKAPEKYIYLARLSGVFAALDEKVGGGRSPWTHLEIFPMHEQLIAELGEEGFDREAAAGQELTVESIVALGEDLVRSVLALSSTTKSVATSAPAPREEPISMYPARLTSREVEVLRVVAAGLTNQQAAERLSVTPRTINAHLTSIYGKIGVTSRTGAVRFALDHDLA